MKKLLVGFLTLATPLFAGAANASITEYSYTGQDFTLVGGTYTKSDFVTGDFIVSSALSNGLLQTIHPTSYSFSDGVQTLDNADSVASFIVSVVSGAITSWTVDIASGGLSPLHGEVISTSSVGVGPFKVSLDLGTDDYLNQLNFGKTLSEGSWTSTAIPEPSTWAMMGLGFAALGFAGYRSRKAVSIAA